MNFLTKNCYKDILYLIMFLSIPGIAQIRLPSLISNHMILQQQTNVSLWGWAPAGTEVKIETGWDRQSYSAVADNTGSWQLKVKTPEAGGPYSIRINDVVINNVLIGEVWICSGQSNMQWSLSQIHTAQEEIASVDYPEIRLFYVARQFADEPKKDCYGMWTACNPQSVETFSAVAYYFGKELHENLNIPVGLIHSSWGGTPAEAWTRREILACDDDLNVYLDRFNEKIKNSEPGVLPLDQYSPGGLYNAMIAPLIPFCIKGAVWYQGEANVNEAGLYEKLFPAMIRNWREDWGQDDFPFYFVQIALYNYDTPVVGAALRDAQRKTLGLPNTGMAVTLDIGDPNDIHPLNKKDVGKRLALWALAKNYGITSLVFSGPLYKSMQIEGQKIRIFFDHTGSGLIAKDSALTHFEIAGADKKFHPALAVIEGNSVVVSSEKVKRPLAVRYAFTNTSEPNLFNKEGLPASSFRTDDWPVITVPVIISAHYDRESDAFKVALSTDDPTSEIRYTMDGSEPLSDSKIYDTLLVIRENVHLKARAFKESTPSFAAAERKFTRHLATGKEISLENCYSSKYAACGIYALVDGICGSQNYNDGVWQGFEQVDLNAEIDLEAVNSINLIKICFLQNATSWIFFPEKVKISISKDGIDFKEIAENVNDVLNSSPGVLIKEFATKAGGLEARYIRIDAKSIGICPDWHPGAGGKAWLFADEIVIE